MDQTRLKWNGWGWSAHRDAMADNEAAWATLARSLNMPTLLATPARTLDDIPLDPPKLDTADRDALTNILGEDRVREDKLERARHAAGRGYEDLLRLRGGDLSTAPDIVVYPRGADEVLAILRHASERGLAVTIFGGGTGTRRENVRSNFRTLVAIDLSGMDRLLEIDKAARRIKAEAGITGLALERILAANDLTLDHHPPCIEFSTLGGWIAGNSTTEKSRASDWLVSARVATPRGFVEADSRGLREMFLGSEGVFGVIVEACVQAKEETARLPLRSYLFRDMASGLSAVHAADAAGLTADARIASVKKTETDANWPEPPRGIGSQVKQAWLQFRGYNGQSVRLSVEAKDASKERKLARLVKRSGGLPLPGHVETQFASPYFRDALLDRGLGIATWQAKTDWQNGENFCESVSKTLQAALAENAPRPGAGALVLYELSDLPGERVLADFICIFPRALDDDRAQWQKICDAAKKAIEAQGSRIETGVGTPSKFDDLGTLARQSFMAVKMSFDPNGVVSPGLI